MTIPASSAPPQRRSPWRLAAIGGLVAAVVAGYAAFTTAGASAAETLLSQGKPATASSTEAAGAYLASEAVDGNLGTRWSSAFSGPQWLQVDLGSSQTVTRVELNWETAAAKAFQIQVSDNESTWTSIYSTTTSTGGNQSLTVTGTGRYVRMYGTQRTTGYGYSLCEFKVYGGGTTTPTDPPPTGRTSPPAAAWGPTLSSSTRACPARRSRARRTRSSGSRSGTSSGTSGTCWRSSRAPTT